MTAKQPGRQGRPWRRIAAQIKADPRNHECWRCHEWIDVRLHHNDPRGFTIDHVQPLALGGSALDPRNLRPAHRGCNSSEGAALRKYTRRTGRAAVRDDQPQGRGAGTSRERQPLGEPATGRPRVPPELKRSTLSESPPIPPPPPPAPRAVPDPPAGAGESGRRLWSSVVDEYDLEEHEAALLKEMVRTVDLLDELTAIVEHDGYMVPGPGLTPRVHPAVTEARQARLALARLSASLRLPAGEDADDGGLRRPQRRGAARAPYGIRGSVA